MSPGGKVAGGSAPEFASPSSFSRARNALLSSAWRSGGIAEKEVPNRLFTAETTRPAADVTVSNGAMT